METRLFVYEKSRFVHIVQGKVHEGDVLFRPLAFGDFAL